MATLTLKNVPQELVARLKQLAKQNRRSLNQETLARLERSLGGEMDSAAKVEYLRRLQRRFADLAPLTDEFVDSAKADGRR
jgi:plasmid stability protein